jgi:hypothetical protein
MFAFLVLIPVVALAIFSFTVAINLYFFLNVYWHPTLGVWSTLVLGYVAAIVAFGLLFFVRFQVPQPYSDKRIIQEIDALKEVDEKLYRRMLSEVYGPESQYRKRGLLEAIRLFCKKIRGS